MNSKIRTTMITFLVVRSDSVLETFDSSVKVSCSSICSVFYYNWEGSTVLYFLFDRLFANAFAILSSFLLAVLYNLTSLINLTSLTTRPAFVPTLDALPALANDAVLVAPFEALKPTATLNNCMSNNSDNVDIVSSQKKKDKKYPFLQITDSIISNEKTIKHIMFKASNPMSASYRNAATLMSSPNNAYKVNNVTTI